MIAPNGNQACGEMGANRESIFLDWGPHHFNHLPDCFIDVKPVMAGRCFLDVRTDAVNDILAAVGIPDDASECFPHFGHVWGTDVQKAHPRTSVVPRARDWMQNFVSQRGSQFSHYA